jgi:molybdate transport system substrate-binding protein
MVGSAIALGGLIAALYWIGSEGATPNTRPILVWCAEAMRPVLDAVKKDYERDFGQRVDINYDASQTILVKLAVVKQGDLFIPADDSYIRLAEERGLVDPKEVFDLARMHAVVIVRPELKSVVHSWTDLLSLGPKFAIGNTETTAIGTVLKEKLHADGRWDELARCKPIELINVNHVLNSVKIGSSDAGIVWDAVARPHPDVVMVELPELAAVQARVQAAIPKSSTQHDAALQFVRYLRSPDKGLPHWQANGFR